MAGADDWPAPDPDPMTSHQGDHHHELVCAWGARVAGLPRAGAVARVRPIGQGPAGSCLLASVRLVEL
jgi:hypothetical protein